MDEKLTERNESAITVSDEEILATAEQILDKYLDAFLELAK